MNRRVSFLYAPRSGAKWICGPRTQIVVPVSVWANGSAHVLGRRVGVFAATPGSWWRNLAVSVAGEVARRIGGLAADEAGEVSIWVPERWVLPVRFLLWAIEERPVSAAHSPEVLASLWDGLRGPGSGIDGVTLARDLYILARDGGPELALRAWMAALGDHAPQVDRIPRWQYRVTMEGDRWVVQFVRPEVPEAIVDISRDGTVTAFPAIPRREARITAPDHFGRPAVYGADEAPEEADEAPAGLYEEVVPA